MHRSGLIKNISLYSFLLIILFFPIRTFASVAGEVNKANGLYKQGKFDDSLGLYQKALDQDGKSPVIKYNLGTAFYKKGDYGKALDYLEKAAQDKNIKIKTKAEYNLGNVLYKSGIQKENDNVDEAIKSLQKALGYYGQSIANDPHDQDSLFNRDFVKKEIERLKQKKEQQQQKQQQQQSQKQNQQNQQKQQGQQSQQNSSKNQGNQNSQENNQQQDQKDNQQSKAREQPNSAQSQAQQQNTQAQAGEDQKELDRKQAQDLLEEYQESEEPKKLLNFNPKKINDRPVIKDW